MAICHHDGIMREIIFPWIKLVNASIVPDPDHMIAVLKDSCNEITSNGTWIFFIVLKVDGSNSVIAGYPIAGTYPDIAPAVLKEMVNDILGKAVLDIELFEIIVRIKFLGSAGLSEQQENSGQPYPA